MFTLYLVRHGEVENPNKIRYYRMPGFHLNERGKQEAEQAAVFLREKAIKRIVHSPLERTTETAVIINQSHEVSLASDERVHEWNETESVEEVARRMTRFWEELRSHPEMITAAVSHRDPIRALLLSLSGKDLQLIEDQEVFPLTTAGIYCLQCNGAETSIQLVFQPPPPTGAQT